MIELPRAALRADEIAAEADFFSFGTNDLTQTTLGFSRDDAEGKFLTYYLEHGILERNPFEVIDEDGVGDLMRIAVERGRSAKPGDQAGDLRRARRRAALGRVLPPARARLRLVLALPRAAGAARCRPGGARRRRRHRRRDRRLADLDGGEADAHGADRDHRQRRECRRAAEARERERAETSADQAADVPTDRDPRDHET